MTLWVFTSTPLTDGRLLCMMQNSQRVLSAKVDADLLYPALGKMVALCEERGDGNEQIRPKVFH